MGFENKLCFVQFLHPGGEHRPGEGQIKGWNRSDHRRKFLLSPGRYVQDTEVVESELMFWGEWEPESQVVEQINQPLPKGPRYIYRPFYIVPRSYAGLQNTDPFVFEKFLYGNCRQHTSAGPTQLRYLERGSVILFGSCIADVFVIDTVFVVADWIDHHRRSHEPVLTGQVPSGYNVVSLNPLYRSKRGDDEGCGPSRGKSYRLYFGASYDEPVDGMFSFVPCLPFEEGTRGFARPDIDSRFITSTQRQGYRLNPQQTASQVRKLWRSVVQQVEQQGLSLGVYAAMPKCREGV